MKLTCFYMGRSATYTLTEAELRNQWFDCVEIGEDLDKPDGREFEDDDEDWPKAFVDSPLDWKDGKATETGCGPWWVGVGRNTLAADDDTVAECDALLVRAGLPRLTVVIVDGVLDMKAMFDMEGVNADPLDALDRAEWRLVRHGADDLVGQDDA